MSNKEINIRIKKLNGAMSQEGMRLTNQQKNTIKNCLTGKTTPEIERKKIIEKYRKIYG